MKIKDIIGKRMKIKPVVINGKAIIRSRTHGDYEMLFDRMTPKYRMINKLRNMVILRGKITPEDFNEHGLIETAKLFEESMKFLKLAYEKSLEEENLWR